MKSLAGAFSNITRLKIINCLLEKEKNVSELINACGLSQSGVSQHLKKLKDMKIVDCNMDGRERRYRLKSIEAGKISTMILKYINEKR